MQEQVNLNPENLVEQLHHLTQRVAELELRLTNADDEVKALSSRITQIEILASTERRDE